MGCHAFEGFLFACSVYLLPKHPFEIFVQFRNGQAFFQKDAPEAVTYMSW